MIKVSVILPVYNAEKYLEECIDSIVGQSLKSVEIICINDGSSDGSVEILERYRENCPNMTVIHWKNQGASRCRNRGIQEAEGEFVCFMDADDFYPSEDVLEVLYANAADHGVKICGGSFSCLSRGNIITKFSGEKEKYVFTEDRLIDYRDYQWDFGYTRFIYDRAFLLENGLEFPQLSRYQDPPFFSRAMMLAGSFFAVNKIVYCCRTGHQDYHFSPKKLEDILCGMEMELKLSAEYGLADLHACIFRRLNQDLYSRQIYRELALGNKRIAQCCRQLKKSINIPMLNMYAGANDMQPEIEAEKMIKKYEDVRTEEEKFLERLRQSEQIIIYGAGRTGKSVAEYILRLIPGKNICFAVSEGMEYPENLNGIEVKEINRYKNREGTLLLVAVLPTHRSKLVENAKRAGFQNLWVVNCENFSNYINNI